jgi:8-oxo-dGTP pyrophosphatase MutT (NUDIX family)
MSDALIRHATVTAFVVWQGRTLLHWHRKERLWLPPGGHVEPNEDPVQAVLREVEEETGLLVEIYGSPPPLQFENVTQLPSPVTVLVFDVAGDGVRHQHIDFDYFCRPLQSPPERFPDPTMRWFTAHQIQADLAHAPEAGVDAAQIKQDVRLLALEAMRREQA